MKYLIVSDIHGASDSAEFIRDIFFKERCDFILLLGDVLYHGPRNDIPPHYEPKKVIEILNALADKIIAIRGNCDAEVDEMVLKFKFLDSYSGIINDMPVHLEHGHHLDEWMGKESLVLYGHIHFPVCRTDGPYDKINPGSITIPKNDSERGYGIWDGHEIDLYTMSGKKIYHYSY